jgi:hypothetical protein
MFFYYFGLEMFRSLVCAFAAPATGFGKVTPLPRGFKRPTRRVMKSPERLPNVRTRAHEYSVSVSANGCVNLTPPYPPRVNRTIEVYPPKGDKRNHWPTQEHKEYTLRWKNVEYKYTPMLRMKPHGGDRWTGRIERVDKNR